MVEPKLSLTLVLQGRTIVSQQDAAENAELLNNESVKFITDKHWETIHFKTRKCYPAKQVLKMSKEAYFNILNTPTDPKFNRKVNKKQRVWDTFSEDKRIKLHCALIAHDLKALSFDYFVLED